MSITRRDIIKGSLALAAVSFTPLSTFASVSEGARRLHFHNTHTGESLSTTYWEQGAYDPRALADIAHVLRDHRCNEVHSMDPKLLDMLAMVHRKLGSRKPFEIISGYRSPKSNALLHATTKGVAVDSFHMYGRAIDIRLTDRRLSQLHDVAWNMQGGGVGFYPRSDFVHMDTGPVRRW